MEMRKEQYEENLKQLGQTTEISWCELKEDFLEQSIEGLKVVDSKGVERRDVPYDVVLDELDENKIEAIYYIEELLAVKIVYGNGKYDVLYRE
jgi:hypothetical protein